MQKYLKLSSLTITLVLFGGCSWLSDNGGLNIVSFPGVYKIDIQQGNIINQDMINQLKPGMSRSQVAYIMGSSLLPDSFNNDRWDYVYTNQIGGKTQSQQTLSLFFKDDKLFRFSGDLHTETNVNASAKTQKNVEKTAEMMIREDEDL